MIFPASNVVPSSNDGISNQLFTVFGAGQHGVRAQSELKKQSGNHWHRRITNVPFSWSIKICGSLRRQLVAKIRIGSVDIWDQFSCATMHNTTFCAWIFLQWKYSRHAAMAYENRCKLTRKKYTCRQKTDQLQEFGLSKWNVHKTLKLWGVSPRENCTDRATAVCRRS
jgi:hypothetical protein